MKVLSTISIVALSALSFGQATMEAHESELAKLLTDLRAAETNQERDAQNSLFKAELEKALENEDIFAYNFGKLKTVGVIDSPDKQMRIINWNVEQEDMSHKYYCYVLWKDKRKNKYNYKELKDMSFGMPSQPSGILTSDNWYGALYYKIIPVKKGTRTLYTVLGWDHNSTMSQLKLLDVMYFSGKNVKLGNPIFKIAGETKNRVFFEHSKKVSMYLNYEADRERIMMDHLSPESEALKGFRSCYVPDLSYDAMVFERNKWTLKEDVIGVNPGEDEEQVVYVKNEKTGEMEARKIKKKWQNPEDMESPTGGAEHVAVTPESLTEEGNETKKKESNNLDKRVDKKDKRHPNDLSIIYGSKKKKKRKKKNR